MSQNKESKSPPSIHPLVFPVLLLLFGAWFLYDGWLTSNIEMQEHQMFNRVGSIILIPWGIIDFIITSRKIKKFKNSDIDDSES